MPHRVTANELRWLGEEADGKRDKDYVVVWRIVDGVEKLGVADGGDLKANEQPAGALDVRTDLEGQGLLGDATIQLLHNGQVIDVIGADSIFITQSAYAKFVIPYYTRFKSPSEIAAMKFEYFGDDYIGVAHFPPSIEQGVPGMGIVGGPPTNLNVVHRDGRITPVI